MGSWIQRDGAGGRGQLVSGRLGQMGPCRGMQRRPATCTRLLLGALLLVGAASAGCSGAQRVGGWLGSEPTPTPSASAADQPRVYFAGAQGLRVYAEPSFSARVVGELALHEKVVRRRLERGYAYVEAERTGLAGWVDNARLLWRLPASAKGSAAAPEPAGATPAAAEPSSSPAPPDATPAPAISPEPVAPATPVDGAAAQDAPQPEATPLPAAVPAPAAGAQDRGQPEPSPTSRAVTPSIFDPY